MVDEFSLITATEKLEDRVRKLHADLSETGHATGDYLSNVSEKIDAIAENFVALAHDLFDWRATESRASLRQLTQIKWILAALLVLQLWRLF